ncbi:DinB family protein [Lysinibacillus mangiferihumi]|uniref:DinB family protein n=1 Tax=Lysinibacillus mangiferihumi TaxID=1130819 RepID=A0A4U2YHV3_9BACI|nr:DinB family protein [Lysinibacillus mangiferihumi]TKI60065.1 DinB family protein [Lysinibacillus mangiferihumi]
MEDYKFNHILEMLFSGEELTKDEKMWAEQVVAFKEATSGQIGAYKIGSVPGFNIKNSLASTIPKIERLLEQCPNEGYDIKPAPNKWSIHQIVGHLADNEVCNSIRVRCILTEETPVLVGYDSDDWQRWFTINDIWTCFNRFKQERLNLIALLETLQEKEWERMGFLDYRGNEQLRVLLGVLAGHDENHIGQLTRTLRYVEENLAIINSNKSCTNKGS